MSRNIALIWFGGVDAYAFFPENALPHQHDEPSFLNVVAQVKENGHEKKDEAQDFSLASSLSNGVILDDLAVESGRGTGRLLKLVKGTEKIVIVQRKEDFFEDVLRCRFVEEELEADAQTLPFSSWKLLIVFASDHDERSYDVRLYNFRRDPRKDDVNALIREKTRPQERVMLILAQHEIEARSRVNGAPEILLDKVHVLYPTETADLQIEPSRRTAETDEEAEAFSIYDHGDIETPFVHELTLRGQNAIGDRDAFFVHVSEQRLRASMILRDPRSQDREKFSAVRKAEEAQMNGPLLMKDQDPCVVLSIDNQIVDLDEDGALAPLRNGSLEVERRDANTVTASFYATAYDDLIGVALPVADGKVVRDHESSHSVVGAWRLYRIRAGDELTPCDLNVELPKFLRDLVQDRIDVVASSQAHRGGSSLLETLKARLTDFLNGLRERAPPYFKPMTPPNYAPYEIGTSEYAFNLLKAVSYAEVVKKADETFESLFSREVGAVATTGRETQADLLKKYRTSRAALFSYENFSRDPALYDWIFCSEEHLRKAVKVGADISLFKDPTLDIIDRADEFIDFFGKKSGSKSSAKDVS